ncbi:S1 RNA-binding domain-containing protein [Agrobacterium tumefaciens]|uniref:S1 RNA-binding domain-containing protein n=1 Tax=Agrobacterium tumefaciens TaxID=358 RepID=UPI003BA0AADE
MIFERPEAAALQNESDVEQKLLYPLLVSEMPSGLAHDPADVHTKANVRKFVIGKGSDQKSYFPDYIVSRGGLPLLVAEAKSPGSDLVEAYREARLYAAELNAQFGSGIAPVSKVIATDGLVLLAGTADHVQPKHSLSLQDLDIYNDACSKFSAEFNAAALDAAFSKLLPFVRPKRYWKPRKLVGGVGFQREEVGMNSFGATISADFSNIFNPLTIEDRNFVAQHGYISSKRRERYIEPIDRIIRASTPISEARSKTLEDTATPSEIVKVLRGTRQLEHQVMLIVGSAGAGKTTFVDHLREKALPADIRAKTVWLHIDMNPAPISRAEIYDWLRGQITEKCKATEPSTDFDELDTIKNVHAVQVTQFRKGTGRLYEGNKDTWNIKLAEHLEHTLRDKHTVAQNHAIYCSANRAKLLIIVLDNCDKRLRDEQLLMFEAAQWLQREFKTLVVLPLREETYDNHHSEPPLDTALKDLVFRIEPPLFQRILQSRVQLAMKAAGTEGKKVLRYELPNGMHVDYPASDQAYYLSSILRSVFEHDMHVRRLIVGLAGRNMRRAMEIFLEFCTSGHIGEDHILKMVQSKGQYVLPLSLVTTVLLRSNLRFYDSDRAYLKNLYSASELDHRPAFFARILMLKWLDERSNQVGPQRLKGYVNVRQMRTELSRFGIEQDVFFRELEAMARGFCVLSEDFRTANLTDDDLIALAPAGRVHLQISSDTYYLAAIAEDTWFKDQASAEAIAERMKNSAQHYSPRTVLQNARACLNELIHVREYENRAYCAVFEDKRFDNMTDLTKAVTTVGAFERSLITGPWVEADIRYPPNSIHEGRIVNHTNYGVFVDLEQGITGLIHSSNISDDHHGAPEYSIDNNIRVRVLDIDHLSRRMSLTLA